MDDATIWTAEGVWNACFGPYETPTSVRTEAMRQGVSLEAYAMSSVQGAVEQGADFDVYTARDVLLSALLVTD